MDSYRREITELISKVQKDCGLSLDEIARELQVSVGMVSKWKNGKFAPRRKNLEALKSLAAGTLQHRTEAPPGTHPREDYEMVKMMMEMIRDEMKELKARVATLEAEKKQLPVQPHGARTGQKV